jgi:hypothetical protein
MEPEKKHHSKWGLDNLPSTKLIMLIIMTVMTMMLTPVFGFCALQSTTETCEIFADNDIGFHNSQHHWRLGTAMLLLQQALHDCVLITEVKGQNCHQLMASRMLTHHKSHTKDPRK